MAATPDGRGYWLVASDGGIFAFGDAQFYGSTGSIHLNEPVVGMAATPDGRGYWLVASDGGIFAFGDAPYLGSKGGSALAGPIVGMTGA
jgi:ribosomal protein L24E